MHKVLDGDVGADILATFTDHDLVGLTCDDAGSRSFYDGQHPIDPIDGLAGMKVRVMPSDLFVDMVGARGANATPMP